MSFSLSRPTWSSVRERLHTPGWQTDVLQLLKAVVAAVAAWVVAAQVLGLEQAFLAPWTALLTVHATVHRTVWRGAQTVLATFLGVIIATAAVTLLGISAVSLGVALLVGLTLARLGALRAEGLTVATTALFVITAGYAADGEPLLLQRLLDTGIGVGIALAVNIAVIPPLNDRSAQAQVDHVDRQLGALLCDMAHQMRTPWESQEAEDWIQRTQKLDTDVQHAWSLVRHATESATWNPRGRRHPSHAHDYAEILNRIEEGVAQTRSMARHVRESSRAAQQWEPVFADRFVDLLDRAGRCIADPEAEVGSLRRELTALADDLSTENLPGLLWPLYGALIASLRIIIDVVDDVATAQPVRT
ncbi:aromatic acid exporter family protein [soil metagenome]